MWKYVIHLFSKCNQLDSGPIRIQVNFQSDVDASDMVLVVDVWLEYTYWKAQNIRNNISLFLLFSATNCILWQKMNLFKFYVNYVIKTVLPRPADPEDLIKFVLKFVHILTDTLVVYFFRSKRTLRSVNFDTFIFLWNVDLSFSANARRKRTFTAFWAQSKSFEMKTIESYHPPKITNISKRYLLDILPAKIEHPKLLHKCDSLHRMDYHYCICTLDAVPCYWTGMINHQRPQLARMLNWQKLNNISETWKQFTKKLKLLKTLIHSLNYQKNKKTNHLSTSIVMWPNIDYSIWYRQFIFIR